MRVREFTTNDTAAWEEFVRRCPAATVFHRLPWRDVIAGVFGHTPAYLLAEDDAGVQGVLPLFVLRTRFFGTMAVSLPFLNYGGVAAANDEAAAALLAEAERIGRESDCAYVEFRHRQGVPAAQALPTNDFKVTSILLLPPDEETLWTKKLHQNVRNKVRKAEKNGVRIETGVQLLDEFYYVFSMNQRDHGTPVLPRRWFAAVREAFGDDARFYVSRHGGRPIGAKLVIDFRDTCHFIWSASTRKGNQYAPVPAMNWAALRDALARGMKRVDFGRSTKDTGSQQFKKYWGVEIEPLYWQYHLLTRTEMPGLNPNNPKFALAIRVWRRLPLFLTHWIGPRLARDLP